VAAPTCAWAQELVLGFQTLFSIRRITFPSVELIHGSFSAAMDEDLQCVHRSLKTRLDDVHFILRDRFQDVVCRVLHRRGAPDTNFNPDELRSAQRFNHRFDAVVTAMPSGLFDPKAARFQIQIIVDENEIVAGELQLPEKTFQRRARNVHEPEGAGEFNQGRSLTTGTSLSGTMPDKTDGPAGSGPLKDPHTGIVAGLGIRRAGIA
jgi:hypothetical protein